jgi:hypothetical protein
VFSSSKSKSKSEAYDNRSVSEGFRSLAAGGNQGSILYYNPGDKVFNHGGFRWKPVLIAGAIAFALWKIPATRRAVSGFWAKVVK